MKLKKRRKSSRFAGSQTAKRGKKARTRGSGNQGGKGWAGTGKRGDQKKTLVIKITGGNNYFGKSRTLRRGYIAPKLKVINLSDLIRNLNSYAKQGIAKENKGIYEINLEGYKILGSTEAEDIKEKLNIKASAASQSAIEKVKAAGGEIVLKDSEEIAVAPVEKEKQEQKPKVKVKIK